MREKLIELLKDTRANAAWHHWGYEESADHLIDNDVVPVVRCKDCKYWECWRVSGEGSGNCLLDRYGTIWNENDFCSYGERRTDETN